MTTEAIARLAERLGTSAELLRPLEVCSADEIERLDETIASAFEAEDDAFTDALEGALRVVPRPLRRAARMLLFPEVAHD